MTDLELLAVVLSVFVLAGAVKGVIGMGLPTVSLGLLAVATDLTTAMALLLVPSFATNIWQACVGGNARVIVKRLWPFLLTAGATVWVGALVLARADPFLLTVLLGLILAVYGTAGLCGARLSIARPRQVSTGLAFGVVNGVLTGMTGSFVVPGVMYLQAINLTPAMLIQAMGMLFSISTAALAVALQGNDYITTELGLWSAAATLPAVIGMGLGQAIRKRLSESLFRRIFFLALIALGLYLMTGSLIDLH